MSLQVSANDPDGIVGLRIYADATLIQSYTVAATNVLSLTYAWNSTQVSNGRHSFRATMTDALGKTTSSPPVSINVSNSIPQVSLSAPLIATGSVSVPVTASDVNGIVGLNIYVDDRLAKTYSMAPTRTVSVTHTWDSTLTGNGLHSLKATAVDSAGSVGSSVVVRITVNNIVPTADPTIPMESSASSVLEDFATLRLNGDGVPLWSPYLGPTGNANQIGTLVGDGTYRVDVGAIPPGGTNVYFQFFPRDNGYLSPLSYARAAIKSGSWNALFNRLSFRMKASATVAARRDGGQTMSLGTYVRYAEASDSSWQGDHFYHFFNPNVYADRWIYVVVPWKPQHEVGHDPSLEWPADPDWPASSSTADSCCNGAEPGVHYYDGLTRFYLAADNGDFLSTPNTSWWFADFAFSAVSGEADQSVASMMATYSGTAYEVSWAGPKNVLQTYDVRYSTTSMKVAGFLSGWDGGQVSNPGSSYTGVIWASPAMDEASVLYVAIRPVGQSAFTEIAIPRH